MRVSHFVCLFLFVAGSTYATEDTASSHHAAKHASEKLKKLTSEKYVPPLPGSVVGGNMAVGSSMAEAGSHVMLHSKAHSKAGFNIVMQEGNNNWPLHTDAMVTLFTLKNRMCQNPTSMKLPEQATDEFELAKGESYSASFDCDVFTDEQVANAKKFIRESALSFKALPKYNPHELATDMARGTNVDNISGIEITLFAQLACDWDCDDDNTLNDIKTNAFEWHWKTQDHTIQNGDKFTVDVHVKYGRPSGQVLKQLNLLHGLYKSASTSVTPSALVSAMVVLVLSAFFSN